MISNTDLKLTVTLSDSLNNAVASANISSWFQEQTWISPVGERAENLQSLLGLVSYIHSCTWPLLRATDLLMCVYVL